MINIVNVGPYNDPDLGGERTYEVRINKDVIARFKHRRSEGLETCLLKAANAVKLAEGQQTIKRLLALANKS